MELENGYYLVRLENNKPVFIQQFLSEYEYAASCIHDFDKLVSDGIEDVKNTINGKLTKIKSIEE